ncbi:MAG: glycosyltransferase family 2 protein [Phycisphaerales bacterium]
MSDATPLRIAVCVVTRHRPTELARLLASLDRLRVPAGSSVEVVVVENDAPRDDPPPRCALPLRRVFEPRAGIPFARNRALDEAAPSSDRIVFLDDDETTEPDLLERLLAAERAFDADCVTGPALPAFPADAPAWAARSGAYDPPRHATGTRRGFAYTNNVMFRSALVRDGALRFDESMRFTGGSDKDFFARFAARGHAIVWADDAVTHEWYPRARLTHRWLFMRSLRLGTVAMKTEGLRGPRARASLLWRAVRFAARAVVRGLGRIHDPNAALALAAWDAGRACGLVLGAFGGRYDEYASR